MRLKAHNNNQLKKALLALIIIHDFIREAVYRSIDASVRRFVGSSINR
jgi:hypothetical protein